MFRIINDCRDRKNCFYIMLTSKALNLYVFFFYLLEIVNRFPSRPRWKFLRTPLRDIVYLDILFSEMLSFLELNGSPLVYW